MHGLPVHCGRAAVVTEVIRHVSGRRIVGVSAGDRGRSAEGPRPCMGYLRIVGVSVLGVLVHGSFVTFRGGSLGGSFGGRLGTVGGGCAPVHGSDLDVFVFCEFWCTGHSSRGRRARGTEEWKSQRDGRTEGWNDGGPEGRRSNICLDFVLATERSFLSPAHAASPRPLARTNETKRFPGWGHSVLTPQPPIMKAIMEP